MNSRVISRGPKDGVWFEKARKLSKTQGSPRAGGFGPARASLVLLFVVFWMGIARAQSDLEYKTCVIWARFLRCFAEETTWPPNAPAETNSTFVVGLFVPDNLVGAFRNLETNRVKGRKVVVKQCHSLLEAEQCHLVFFSTTEENNFLKILDQLKETSVLTVGESTGFARQGGMITLGANENHKASFKINREAANHAKLRLSADLLDLH